MHNFSDCHFVRVMSEVDFRPLLISNLYKTCNVKIHIYKKEVYSYKQCACIIEYMLFPKYSKIDIVQFRKV